MKVTVAIIFGGRSAEHEISLRSATNIFNAVDQKKFDPLLLGVDKKGNWCYNAGYTQQEVDLTSRDYFAGATAVYLNGEGGKAAIIDRAGNKTLAVFQAAFPIIHGTFGEDGTLQALLKAIDIPFAGPDVLGSAVGMDKDVAKRLLRDAGIAVAGFYTLKQYKPQEFSYEEIVARLGLPLFVKPANAGSSVGVSKVTNEEEYHIAMAEAFRFDRKILVEEAIVGKEVECAVLGNEENLQASVIGEIVPTRDFYSYDAKYISTDGATMKIPAAIERSVAEELRHTAIRVFETLCCEGMARVDFFLKEDNTFVLNEINTLPGFTSISMYPKLWEATGISYTDLITRLIQLGMERTKRNGVLATVATK
jgi:D-alanine-D-alanine ligase